MSMGLVASSGFILDASFRNLGSVIGHAEADELLAEFDGDEDEMFISYADRQDEIQGYVNGIPISFKVIEIGEDDIESGTDISVGKYFLFDEQDLFKKDVSELGKGLQDRDVFPEFNRWTVWG